MKRPAATSTVRTFRSCCASKSKGTARTWRTTRIRPPSNPQWRYRDVSQTQTSIRLAFSLPGKSQRRSPSFRFGCLGLLSAPGGFCADVRLFVLFRVKFRRTRKSLKRCGTCRQTPSSSSTGESSCFDSSSRPTATSSRGQDNPPKISLCFCLIYWMRSLKVPPCKSIHIHLNLSTFNHKLQATFWRFMCKHFSFRQRLVDDTVTEVFRELFVNNLWEWKSGLLEYRLRVWERIWGTQSALLWLW